MTELQTHIPVVKNKLVLLGDVSVGKTSLGIRFSTGDFKENVQSTLGAQFITHKIVTDKCILQFDIWDTAGQERFQSQGALYYKNSKGALVAFDVTSEKSFDRAKSWVDELMENADPDIIICQVGNKIDLANQRKVTREEAEGYSNNAGQLYFECSAKTGEGVEEAFVAVMKKIPCKLEEELEAEKEIELNNRKKTEQESGALQCSC